MIKKTLGVVAVAAIAALGSGCASIVNDSSQPIRIDAKQAGGELVNGAECKLTNDYGTVSAKSGDTVQIHRSSKDLDIMCKDPAQANGNARAISRANMGLAGNIIFGGGIGAIIDHTKGTAYTYPTWMQVVFGQTLVFDRRDEQDGQPVPGKPPEVPASK